MGKQGKMGMYLGGYEVNNCRKSECFIGVDLQEFGMGLGREDIGGMQRSRRERHIVHVHGLA